jgi:hypothetical protein
MKKERWSKLRRQANPNHNRFSYRGTGDGRVEFYRHNVPFVWGPLDVDRDQAQRLVRRLNELTGGSVERVGRELCDTFKREYDEGRHRATPIAAKDPNADVDVVSARLAAAAGEFEDYADPVGLTDVDPGNDPAMKLLLHGNDRAEPGKEN